MRYSPACHIGSRLIARHYNGLQVIGCSQAAETLVWRQQFNPAKTVYRCLQYNFEEGGSTNEPELFMMVRREIAQSRCETGTRSREAPMRT